MLFQLPNTCFLKAFSISQKFEGLLAGFKDDLL
jgi:hypothetical protein